MQTYVGLDKEDNGGITMIGRIIRDAWVFGILQEGDNFAGKTGIDLQILMEKVNEAWAPYGQLPSQLTPELAARHGKIYAKAIAEAKANGWDPELGEDD